jgi:hypothetical protein
MENWKIRVNEPLKAWESYASKLVQFPENMMDRTQQSCRYFPPVDYMVAGRFENNSNVFPF